MFITALILAATLAVTPTPAARTTTPGPALSRTAPSATAITVVTAGGTRTLADVAAERKLGVKGVKGGGFSAAQSSVASAASKMTDQERWELEQGEPLHRNTTFLSDGGTSEQLVYPNGVYVYFRNGKFSGAQMSPVTTHEIEKGKR